MRLRSHRGYLVHNSSQTLLPRVQNLYGIIIQAPLVYYKIIYDRNRMTAGWPLLKC